MKEAWGRRVRAHPFNKKGPCQLWTVKLEFHAAFKWRDDVYYTDTEKLSELVDELIHVFGSRIRSITITQ